MKRSGVEELFNAIRGGLILICLLPALSGCTTSVQVSGSIPTPRVNTVPAVIGVYFSDEFRSFKHEESIKNAGTWEIELGHQNVQVIKSLFEGMFEEVREIGPLPLNAEEMAGLDGILVPRITEYAFLVPSVSGLRFFSASIHYRISFYNRKGEKMGDWDTVGYGKSELAGLSQGKSLEAATREAIRDGGVQIAVKMIEHPSVAAWTHSLLAKGGKGQVHDDQE